MIVNAVKIGIIAGQFSPLTPGAHNIENGIHYGSHLQKKGASGLLAFLGK
jgi:hypothetical protein